MSDLRVNLHGHSNLSDGALPPEALAERLAAAGVQVAALTDHDTVEGQARFREALTRHGVAWIPGVELSCSMESGPVHLLAYGFRPDSPPIEAACRRGRLLPEGGALPAREAIALVHEAQGRVFLAHPLTPDPDPVRLQARVEELKASGLDGLEAIYPAYPAKEQEGLLALADGLGLAVSAGCDFHDPEIPGVAQLGVAMPEARWTAFRRLLSHPGRPEGCRSGDEPGRLNPGRPGWRGYALRIAAPTLLALSLMLAAVFGFLLPAFQEALLGRKREMIRELANSACSVLQEYEDEVAAGRLSLPEAQAAAAARLQYLRYGPGGKDYFWITDLRPRMVMHPFRPDLNGKDVSAFADPKGNRVFVASVALVKARREGYLEYVWQWKDDPGRLAPKQSYVRLFAPWGWVVGTGIYIEDVQAEITQLTGRMVQVSIGVSVLVALLLLFVAQQSLRSERQRWTAEEALRESHERYRALAEASREGTLLVVRGRGVFANPTFLDLAGRAQEELALLDLDELLELPEGGPASAWVGGPGPAAPAEARLRRPDGHFVDVLLNREPVFLGGREGVILLVRDLRAQKEVAAALDESQARFRSVAENLRVGVFRVDLAPGWPVLEANGFARRLLGLREDAGRIADALADPAELDRVEEDLRREGEVQDRVVHLTERLGGRAIALSATLVRGEGGVPRFLDAIAEDVTSRERTAWERESLIAELQGALQHLSEPVERLMMPAHTVPLDVPAREAAAILAGTRAETLVVVGPGGEPLGLLGRREFTERVVAGDLGGGRRAFEVMTSPLPSIEPLAPGFAALARMRDLGVGSLAVKGGDGRLRGVVRGLDLMQAERVPMALLLRTVGSAGSAQEVAAQRERLPILAKGMLEAGARPRHIGRAMATAADAMAQRLLALAEADLGPPPAPYAWLTLGSQGREEQSLLSDQDTALILGPGSEDAAAYFAALSERVGDGLEAAGYPACKGGMMARNPRWRRSLESWKGLFSTWFGGGEPAELLELATFFDFRCAHGDASMAQELKRHVLEEARQSPAFLAHLARQVVQFRVPGTFLGRGRLDLKELQGPLVAFARLYALRHGMAETSTYERLRRLHELGALSPSGFEEAIQLLDFLFALRLRRQAERLTQGLPADNLLDPRDLTHLEEKMLKQAGTLIATLQKKAGYDFLGSA